MGCLSLLQVAVQLVVLIKLIVTQSEGITFRSVKHNAIVVGVEPFYNQTTFSLTECYLVCLQHLERCWFVEVANVNEAWSCKLFEFNNIGDIKNHLKFLQGSEVSAPKLPQDCVELKKLGIKDSGVYFVRDKKTAGAVNKKVFCDMTTDGGGWIVMQKRFDGSVDFNRDWNSYRDGFGDVKGEHWVGNEFVHQYTNAYPTELIVEGIAFDGAQALAKMENFTLSDEVSKYVLEYEACHGLCEGLNDHVKGKKFSAHDQDNDNLNAENCAQKYSGGWWFTGCFFVFLNGKYSDVSVSAYTEAIHWFEFRGFYESLKKTTMLIRRIR